MTNIQKPSSWLGNFRSASLPKMLLAMAVGLVFATVIGWVGIQLGVGTMTLTIVLTILWPILYGLIVSRQSDGVEPGVESDTKSGPPAAEPHEMQNPVQAASGSAVELKKRNPMDAAPRVQDAEKGARAQTISEQSDADADSAELLAQLATLKQLVQQDKQTNKSK
ncbi:hypothetical protein [Rhodoferax antarcticus]|nr:hypothetical protein [Rhodoferax antarcticus]